MIYMIWLNKSIQSKSGFDETVLGTGVILSFA